MICKKCNANIPDGSKFCACCGARLEDKNKVTFKGSIKALFAKFMLFEGKTTRKEFNFGLLFIYIILQALSVFVLVPYFLDVFDLALSGETDPNVLLAYDGIIHPLDLTSLVISVILSIFLVAPIYRRFNDCGIQKVKSIIFTIIFVVGQMSVFSMFIGNNNETLVNILNPILTIISYISTGLLIFAILRKSANN